MSETINIAEIAVALSKDIFKHFRWRIHPKMDDNFPCVNHEHLGSDGKGKTKHPCDVVFHYEDPYTGATVFLHTDLKSYKKSTITATKIRDALRSLAMAIECARYSADWRQRYSVDSSDAHEVRGLLFVHNRDHGHSDKFETALNGVDLKAIPVAADQILHFIGPREIQRLYSIGNDMMRLRAEGELPEEYGFYYPDLVRARRLDDKDQAATIESLAGPYLIVKHGEAKSCKRGYIVYYNRSGSCVEEFTYFLDCLSRFQMLDSSQMIRIRIANESVIEDFRSVFQMAVNRYARAWGFESSRTEMLMQIGIERITSVTDSYRPSDMGWRT